MFCHAGGNSANYRPWDALLTPEVSLVVIELPGRLTRFRDPLISGEKCEVEMKRVARKGDEILQAREARAPISGEEGEGREVGKKGRRDCILQALGSFLRGV